MVKEFEKFTDPESVKAALQQRLPALVQGDLLITGCRILHLHYKTYLKKASREKSFLAAAYQLEISNRASGERNTQIIFAKIFPGNRSYEELNKAIRQHLCPTVLGVPLLHLADLGMVVWTFPNDPALRDLPAVADADKVKKHLPCEALSPGFSANADTQVKIEVVNYRPELRCTARYLVRQGAMALTLFGKTFADERGREIHQRMEWLWRLSQQHPGQFPMPRPLAYNEEVKTVWQAELPGEPLTRILNRDNYGELISAAANRLAFLHHSGAPVSSCISLSEHATEVGKKTAKLAQAFPAVRELLEQTVRLLEHRLPQLPLSPERVIHGDFHLRQLMVHAGQVSLFDFDEFALGDPAQDLANFIADLHAQLFADDWIKALAATLVEAYSQHSGEQIASARLHWHLSVQFITRAYRAYLQQKPLLADRVSFFARLAYQTASAEALIA
ncbi:MAG: aminoglycoside phosphotransferase family protein [Blastocatellales bacterium]